jgi:hypothetical protein
MASFTGGCALLVLFLGVRLKVQFDLGGDMRFLVLLMVAFGLCGQSASAANSEFFFDLEGEYLCEGVDEAGEKQTVRMELLDQEFQMGGHTFTKLILFTDLSDPDSDTTIYYSSTLEIQDTQVPVPEPSTFLLLTSGFLGIYGFRKSGMKKIIFGKLFS